MSKPSIRKHSSHTAITPATQNMQPTKKPPAGGFLFLSVEQTGLFALAAQDYFLTASSTAVAAAEAASVATEAASVAAEAAASVAAVAAEAVSATAAEAASVAAEAAPSVAVTAALAAISAAEAAMSAAEAAAEAAGAGALPPQAVREAAAAMIAARARAFFIVDPSTENDRDKTISGNCSCLQQLFSKSAGTYAGLSHHKRTQQAIELKSLLHPKAETADKTKRKSAYPFPLAVNSRGKPSISDRN